MNSIGGLEYKIFELDTNIQILKRKIEFLQAKINRDESVSTEEMEEIITREFEEYNQKLSDWKEEIMKSLKTMYGESQPLNREEKEEFKTIYRLIIKKLHPDIHPNLSPRDQDFFRLAVIAYQYGDLNKLRTILLLINDKQESEEPYFKEEIDLEIESLNKLIKVQDNKLKQIKVSFPYNLKGILQNKRKTLEVITNLQAAIKEHTKTLEHYQKKFAKMGGTKFDHKIQ
jgi:hypothetical protein